MQAGIKTHRDQHLQARTTKPGGWNFTSIKASVAPYYPDGPPGNFHVASPDISPQALPKSATQGKLVALPKGEGFKSEVSAPTGWGSASTAFSSIEMKGHAITCPIEALDSKAKGVETKVELDITGTIDTFMWGEGQWGGCGYGKNNVFSKLLGFLEGDVTSCCALPKFINNYSRLYVEYQTRKQHQRRAEGQTPFALDYLYIEITVDVRALLPGPKNSAQSRSLK